MVVVPLDMMTTFIYKPIELNPFPIDVKKDDCKIKPHQRKNNMY